MKLNENCSKCGGKAKLETVECSCKCGATIHYRKTCLVCGFVSYVHRYVLVERGEGDGNIKSDAYGASISNRRDS